MPTSSQPMRTFYEEYGHPLRMEVPSPENQWYQLQIHERDGKWTVLFTLMEDGSGRYAASLSYMSRAFSTRRHCSMSLTVITGSTNCSPMGK